MFCAFAAVVVGVVSGRSGAETSKPLLPDLVMAPHLERDVVVAAFSGRKWLVFTTSIANIGVGPMEIDAARSAGTEWNIWQRIFRSNGTSYRVPMPPHVGSYTRALRTMDTGTFTARRGTSSGARARSRRSARNEASASTTRADTRPRCRALPGREVSARRLRHAVVTPASNRRVGRLEGRLLLADHRAAPGRHESPEREIPADQPRRSAELVPRDERAQQHDLGRSRDR